MNDVNRLLIRLNPTAHGKVFQRDLYREDRYCMACHHLQLRDVAPGRTCVQCHMEPREVLGLSGKAKNHFFPGSNTTIPLLTNSGEYAVLNERWMQGLFLRRSLEDPYDHDQYPRVLPDADRLAELSYLGMSAQVDPAPKRGGMTRLRIETSNSGIGHGFPSSSLDLEEVWLEVRVTDESGRLLFSSGGLDDSQSVLPNSHRLGGHMIGLDGKLVTHYRVWQVSKEVIDRMIHPGQSGTDEFVIALPNDCGKFLNVEAAWRYRKLNRDYWVWAYGPDTTTPSPRMARGFWQFQVSAQTADDN